MLDIKLLRKSPEIVKEGLKKRNADFELVDKVLELDKRRRRLLQELETARAEVNKRSKAVPDPKEIGELKKIKEKVRILEEEFRLVENELNEVMYHLPNLPLPDVPAGKTERDNIILYEVGIDGKKTKTGESKKREFGFEPKKHWELERGQSKSFGTFEIIDIRGTAKVSGSRFGSLEGLGVMLEFNLINFTVKRLADKNWIEKIIKNNKLDVAMKEFIPIIPPVLINEESMRGMGYIDTKEDKEERYFLEKDRLYLVGTAEQSIGPRHSNDVFEEKDLPVRYLGFSSSFRREAGSYGKDVRGIMRVHQFDKLEMFSYARPEDSVSEHKFLVAIQEELVKELGLAYRVVQLSTGDLARPSASTFDIELWFPGLGEYKETHSASNTTDFQSRRLNIRLRRKSGELEFVHTLNATAAAMGRMILAILENGQTKEGKIKLPAVLK